MNDSHFIYAELLSSIVRFNNFNTILYFGPEDAREHCQLEHWVEWTGNAIPWLIWRSEATLKLSQFINAELLVLACLPRIYRRDLLSTVTQSLQHLRQAKVLIELASEEDVGLVSRVLLFCRQNEMLNVATIFTNFGETQSIYSYAAYPRFELRKERFEQQFYSLYPEQSLDLKGFRLRTQPDLSEPNSILSFDQRGQPRLFGYVWNMVEEYARKHNAQLQLSYIPEQDKPLSHIQVLDLARDGYVDIAASVQPVTMRYIERYHEYAYPVHMGSWCTMLPKEPLIGVRDSYAWLMPVQTICLLCVLWLIYESLRGRWQRHRRLLSIGWWLLAVLLATNVLGRLVSLFVAPPSKPPIDSFAALDKSKLRVFGLRSEYNAYDFDMRTQYSAIFQLSDKMSELIALRNSLNTSFAYTVTHTKWLLYEEQQSHSTRPLFYFSQDLCYYQFIPFALVIPENSPHRAALDHLMLQFGQSGLYAHWTAKSFHYMVQAGRLHMRNFSDPHVIRPLKIRDVHHVLSFYAICVLISLTLFACEHIRYRLKRSWMDI
ncbi:uncharacterized protein LOC133836778 [Drosophila sulfurigaster albostrigata]|uniref:uncharacterized protein LOC133836778 n=1 Tax=Drosophila sulfurigaster albostrigata TaxID=89887 RepID=UPI002D218D3B|nr:uncharacterized protein LOC133836778 [Drosophila sulfurigaster albostrigata]